MPLQIDPKQVRSSAFARSGPTRPDYEFSGASFETLGSADTWLGRQFGVYRDELFNPYLSQNDQRYHNSPWTSQAFNLLGQVAVKGAGGAVLGGLAASEAVSMGPINLLRGVSMVDQMNEGFFGTLSTGLTNLAEDYMPLFNTEEYRNRNFGGKLAHPGQLAVESVDTLGFLASSIGLAGAVGKLNAGAKAVNALYRGRPLLAQMAQTAAAAPRDLASKARTINAVLSNELLALTESAAESKEAGESLRNKYISDRLDGKNQLSDEEIESRVNMAENNVMWLNMITNSITNMPFTRLASPLVNKGARAGEDYAIRLLGNNFKPKSYKTMFEKFVFDKGYTPGVITKSLLAQTVSEALEESLQYSIQKVNEASDKAITFADSIDAYYKDIVSGNVVTGIFTDKERGNAAGLGALIGGVTPVVAAAWGGSPWDEARNFRETQKAYIDRLSKSYTNAVSTSLYAKNEAAEHKLYTDTKDGETSYIHEVNGVKNTIPFEQYEKMIADNGLEATGGTFSTPESLKFSEDGLPIIDEAKRAKFLADSASHVQMTDLIDQELLKGNPDPIVLSLARSKQLDTLAATAVDSSTRELVLEKFETLAQTADDSFEELGYASASELRQQAERDVEYLKRAMNLYDVISKDVLPSSMSDLQTNELRKKRLFNLAASANHMRELALQLQSQASSKLTALLDKYDKEDQPIVAKLLTDLTNIEKWKQQLDSLLAQKENFVRTNQRERLSKIEQQVEDTARKIDSTVKSLSIDNAKLYSTLASNSEVESITTDTVKASFLEDQIKENDVIYNQIANPRTGMKFFKDYLAGKRPDLKLTEERYSSTLTLTPNTTAAEYLHYEDRAIKKARLQNKINTTSEMFYSELMSDLVELLTTASSKDSLIAIRQFVELLLEKSPKLTQIATDAVGDLIDKAKGIVDSSMNDLINTLTSNGGSVGEDVESSVELYLDSIFEALSEEENPVLQAAYDAVSEASARYESFKAELGILSSPTIKQDIEALAFKDVSFKTDEQLRKKVAEDTLLPAQNIVKVSEFDGEGIAEDYTDLASVELEIQNVTKLDEIFNELQYDTKAKELLAQLQKIKELVIQNLENKEIANARQDLEYATGVLKGMGITDEFSKSQLYSLLSAKMGKEQVNAFDATIKTNPVLGAKILIDAVNIHLGKEYIRQQQSSVFTSLASILSKFDTRLYKPIPSESVAFMPNSPQRGFNYIAETLSGRFNVPALREYLKNYNVVKLRDNLKLDTSNEARLVENLLTHYLQLEGLKLAEVSTSTFKALTSKLLKEVNTEKAKTTPRPAPSNSQERVIYQLTQFITSPFNNRRQAYDNVALLKAPAGAGKSLVVTPYLLKLVGLNPSQVITAAPKAPAASIIASSTASSYGASTLKDLTQKINDKKLDKDVKLIVVDEASAASYQDIHDLVGALNAYMDANENHQVKILLIYDPNQVSRAASGKPLIESVNFSLPSDTNPSRELQRGQGKLMGTEMHYIQNVYDLTPLSVTYRSDVADIVNVQNQFISNTHPETLVGSSSVDPLSSFSSPLLGFYGEASVANMFNIIANSVRADTGRSRAIIVDTEEKKQKYEEDVKRLGLQVQVYTVSDSSGITVDEVYVDVVTDKTQAIAFQNQLMYTATSRASKFLYVGRYKAKNSTDASIPQKAEANAKFKTSRHEQFIKEKTAELELYEKVIGDAKPTTKTDTAKAPETKPTPEEEKLERAILEEEAKMALDIPIDEEIPTEKFEEVFDEQTTKEGVDPFFEEEQAEDTDEGTRLETHPNVHILKFPQNSVFKNLPDVSGPAMIVGYTKNNKPHYAIVKSIDSGYELIGVLGKDEIDEVESTLNVDLKGLTLTRMRNPVGGRKGFVTFDSVNPSNSLDIFISANSSPLSFRFSEAPTASFNTEEEAKNFVTHILSRMYGPNFRAEINFEEIMDNFDDFIKWKIFLTDKEIAAFTSGSEFRPRKGRPYMLITGLKYRSTEVNTPTFFIPLAPKVFNKKSKLAEYLGVNEITTLLGLIEDFHTQVASIQWPSPAYKEMRLGMPFQVKSNQIYYPFHQFVNTLSEIHSARKAGKGEYVVSFASESYNALAKASAPHLALPDFNSSIVPDSIAELAAKIDELVHGIREPYDVVDVVSGEVKGKKRPRRAYRGRAQLAMDSIAKSNFVITLPNGKNKILRDVRHYYVQGEGDVQSFSGVSLLGPLKFEHSGGKSFNSLVPSKIKEKAMEFLISLQKRGKSNSPRAQYLKTIIDAGDNAHLLPFSLEDLKSLFIDSVDKDGDFSGVSEGFGLRTPLPLYDWNAQSSNSLTPDYSLSQSYLDEIRPTSIGISREPSALEVEQTPTPTIDKTDLASAQQKLRKAVEEDIAYDEVVLTSEEYEALTASGVSPLQYYLGLKSEGYYTTLANNFIASVKEVIKKISPDSLLKSLVYSLNLSPTISLFNETGSRDFIKAAIIAHLNQKLDPVLISKFATVPVTQDGDGIQTYEQDLFSYLDNPDFMSDLSEINHQLKLIADAASIKFNPPQVSPEGDGLFSYLNYVAKDFSSQYRAYFKENGPVQLVNDHVPDTNTIPNDSTAAEATIELYVIDRLKEAYENDDKQAYEELAALHGIEISYDDESALRKLQELADEVEGVRDMSMVDFFSDDIGDAITDEEAVNIYDRLVPVSILERIRRIFKKSKGEQFRIVDFNYMQKILGKNNWGLYKNGVIHVIRDANGMVGSKVVRHEAFHKIFNEYLTPAERAMAYSVAGVESGLEDRIQLEEYMADKFSSFARGSRTVWDYLSYLFAKVLRFFNYTYNNLRTLEQFFTEIEDGYYSRKISEGDVERDLVIRGNWPSADHFVLAKEVTMRTFSTLYNNRNSAVVYSFDEAVGETQKLVAEYAADPSRYSADMDEEFMKQALSPIANKSSKAFKAFFSEYFSNTKASVVSSAEKSRKIKEYNKLKTLLSEFDDVDEIDYELSKELDRIEYQDEEGNTVEFTLEELQDEVSQLHEELHNSEIVDPKTKITGRVKQRLVTVEYMSKGKVKLAEFDRVFSTLLDLLPQASYTSLDELLASIDQRIRVITNNKLGTGIQNSVRLATSQFIGKQIENVKTLLEGRSDIAFSKDVNYPNEYVIIGPNARALSYTEAKALNYTIETKSTNAQGLTESTDEFITRVARQHSIPKQDLVNAFYLYEDINFFTSLVGAMVSLRENNPYVGIEQWKDFKYKLNYFPVRSAGSKAVLESDIKTKFAQAYDKDRSVISDSVIKRITEASLVTGEEGLKLKIKRINSFLSSIGLARLEVNSTIGSTQIEELFNSMLASLKNMKSKAFTEDDALEYPGLSEHTGNTLLLDEGNFVTKLVEALGTTSDAVKSTSFIRGDGKKAYRFIDASFQSGLLDYLAKALDVTKKGLKGYSPSHLSVVNGKLKTTSPFLTNNPFVKGLNTIYKYAPHDSFKRKGADQYATYLYGEGSADYYKRTFLIGFLSGIKNHSVGGEARYFQFLPIPSNRRTIDSLLIKAYNKSEATNVLKTLILAEKSRPQTSELMQDANYRKRSKMFHLPGLEGESIDSNLSVDQLAKKALDALETRATQTAVEVLASMEGYRTEALLNKTDLIALHKAAATLGVKNTAMTSEQFYTTRKKLTIALAEGKDVSQKIQELEQAYQQQNRDLIAEVFKVFYLNSSINQYSLSQLIYGDESFYKSKEDETKRIQVATATGDVSLLDDTFGYPRYSTVGVIRDINPVVPQELTDVREEAYKQDYTLSDGQGYMLPEAYEMFAKSRGIDAETDVTLKPVYFGLDEMGRPSALKYSLIVLTDDLVTEYPHLGKLRSAMRDFNKNRGDKPPMHQAVFESAVKVGKPVNSSGEVDTYINEFGDIANDSGAVGFTSTMRIDNKFFRTQLNPAKKVEATVANTSQGTAFMNTNGLNPTEALYLHRLNQIILDTGDILHSRLNAISSKGTLSVTSKKKLRQSITAQGDIPGLEDVVRLLGLKDAAGRYMVSLDLPIIAQKAIATLASKLSKATVGFRFPGSKLVLQSEYGTYSSDKEQLKWKDEDGFTEVLLPESYREFFSEGDVVTNGMVAFRIPATNYHSLLALKVKGFYKVPQGSKGNVVIAPSLIVYYHGSDYDIDTLFLIKKQKFEKDYTEDINLLAQKYGLTQFDSELLKFVPGEYPGFSSKDGDSINGVPLSEIMAQLTDELSRKISTLTIEYAATDRFTEGTKRDTLRKQINEANKDLQTLVELTHIVTRNAIVDLFSKNIKEPRNRKDLLTPISFARVSNLRSDMKKSLEQAILSEEFIDELHKAGLLTRC